MHAATRMPWLPGSVACVVCILLAACGQAAETVFHQQHQVSIALAQTILEAEGEGGNRAQRLYRTEQELNEACAPLQEAGYREMNEEEIDGALEFEILVSLDDCRAKAQEVEHLLRRIDPEIARYFLGETPTGLNGTANFSNLNRAAALRP